MARPEQFHLVARNEVDYLRPVRGVGRVRVRVWIERIGRSSLTFACRMMPMDQDLEHARARRTIVHVASDTLAPQPWSDRFRETLAPFCQSPA
jgi:acyl-CoA thioester hydrolase